ncbi:MAG TPA: BrnA antitoxin family protein [Terriglobales bacterium]|nr:BrnA antitoxin family protein [Terriglobales bacterium]
MKQTKRVTKTRKRGGRKLAGKKIGTLRASADEKPSDEKMAEMYRPLKKPVTLRLDADVLAWFKTPGRGYQTRINRALRTMMLKEKKESAR